MSFATIHEIDLIGVIMIKIVSLFFMALLLNNCSSKNLSPTNVSDYFWSAQKEKHLDDAKKFVRPQDQKNIALQKSIKIKRFTFEKASVQKDSALVPTKMFLQSFLAKDSDRDVEIDFDTTLEKTDDGWKVNLSKTKEALYIETAKKFSKGVGIGILGKLQDKMQDFQKFQGVLHEIAESMKKSLE